MNEGKSVVFELDNEVQRLYTRHDGGEDTPKGVFKAADYPDYDSISDKEAAALMVSLDIYRGIPENGGFVFGPKRYLAHSAFRRMLMAACGRYKKEIFAVEDDNRGITVNEARNMVVGKMGLADARGLDAYCGDGYLDRDTASGLLAAALRLSDGTGELPYLFFVKETTCMEHLRLPEHFAVAAPDGMLATLTVNGVFQPFAGGWDYDGDVVVTVTPRYELYRYIGILGNPPFFEKNPDGSFKMGPTWWNDWSEPFRTALYVHNGEKLSERSIDPAYHETASGIELFSNGEPTDRYGANDFNGIIVNGDRPGAKYEINNLTARFNGNSRDDFQGMGSTILLVGDGTETLIENADISNYGTVRSTLVMGGGARALIKDSRLETHDGIFEKEYKTGMDSYSGDMRQAPRQGGFEGNCRCTNMLDKAVASYHNCQVLAEKWGVLSTDNNDGVRVAVADSFIGITGGLNKSVDTTSEATAREALAKLPFQDIYGPLERDLGDGPYASAKHPAGYGTYSIGDSTVKFAGSTVCSVDFSGVCANGAASIVYCASTPENIAGEYGLEGLPLKGQNTVVYCNKTGLQIHRGDGTGLVEIKDNTVFHCGAHCVVLKSSGAGNFHADNSTLISEMGVVLQMMDEDDVDAREYSDPVPPTAEDRAYAAKMIASGAIDVFHAKKEWDSFAKFSNMTVNGDSFNSCGYTGLITPEDIEAARTADNPFPGPARMGGSRFHCENARNLELTLENCQYNGAISTARAWHFDPDTGEKIDSIPRDRWYCICVVKSDVQPVYQAGLILKLEKGSVWNVPRTCYLSSLTMDDTSRIAGRVFLNGEALDVQPGVTYEGMITVEPAGLGA